jgi:hypothetical protein
MIAEFFFSFLFAFKLFRTINKIEKKGKVNGNVSRYMQQINNVRKRNRRKSANEMNISEQAKQSFYEQLRGKKNKFD